MLAMTERSLGFAGVLTGNFLLVLKVQRCKIKELNRSSGFQPGQSFGVLGQFERINHVVQIAVHELIQGIDSHSDSVIRHPTLREIIGPDLGRTVAGGDHGFAFASFFGIRFLFLKFIILFLNFYVFLFILNEPQWLPTIKKVSIDTI